MQRDADADRQVLLAGDVAELAHELRVAVAASPIGSGQHENPPAAMLVAGLSLKAWRGSDEIVTGMPSRVLSASLLQPVVPLGQHRGARAPSRC